MAKRYKEKTTKKKNKPSKINISKKFIISIFIVIAISVGLYFFITFNHVTDLSVNSELNVKRYEDLTSDVFSARNLNDEVMENIDIEGMQIIKIQYKLESLEKGKVILLYKIKDNKMLEVSIDIESKKIEEAKVVESPDDVNRKLIDVNLDEDIKEYYEKNITKLKPDEGKNILNIILMNNEIIITPSVD